MSLLRWFAVVGLYILGIYLLVPGRNLFGNPVYEREVQRCTLPGGAVVRLYQGDGGATTAYWYTVTHEGGWSERERQIFYAYSYPEVRGLACRPEGVVLTLSERSGERLETLPLGRIDRELRGRPVTLSHGGPLEGRGLRPVSIGVGTLLLTAGLALGMARKWSRWFAQN